MTNKGGRPPGSRSLKQVIQRPAVAQLVERNIDSYRDLQNEWKSFDPDADKPARPAKAHPLIKAYFSFKRYVQTQCEPGSKAYTEGMSKLATMVFDIQRAIDAAQREASSIAFRIVDRTAKGSFQKATTEDDDDALIAEAEQWGLIVNANASASEADAESDGETD